MSEKKTGGPAFAHQEVTEYFTESGTPYKYTNFRGMTLRDYFAGQILMGYVACARPIKIEGKEMTAAEAAYYLADGMIEEREK